MKFSCSFVALATLFTVSTVSASDRYTLMGRGFCKVSGNGGSDLFHEYLDHFAKGSRHTPEECDSYCSQWPEGLWGFSSGIPYRICNYDDGYAPGGPNSNALCPAEDDVYASCYHMYSGIGDIVSSTGVTTSFKCYDYNAFPVTEATTEATGDPHCKY